MKRLTISSGILLFLFVLSIYSGLALKKLTDQSVSPLKNAQEMATQNNWDATQKITDTVYNTWDRHSFALHTLLRHAEADEILLSFRCVEQYIELKEMDQYAAANITLITQLELLAEMEKASWDNVL